MTPSPKALRLVKQFEESAGEAFWQRDQGIGAAVPNAENACARDRRSLLRYIALLEAAKEAGMVLQERAVRDTSGIGPDDEWHDPAHSGT